MAHEKKYKTRAPIDDVLLAAHLLMGRFGSPTHRYFVTGEEYRDPYPFAEIHVEYWGGGYGKCEYTDTDYYQVTNEVRDALLHFFVRPAQPHEKRPFHSYEKTYVYEERRWGESEFQKLREERQEKAKKNFIPGTHSSFSSILFPQGMDWERGRDEKFRTYRLYFDFKTPLDERIRIWDDTGEVENRSEKEKT